MMRALAAALVLVVALGALSGCGRKGKLQPPPASTSMNAPMDTPAPLALAG